MKPGLASETKFGFLCPDRRTRTSPWAKDDDRGEGRYLGGEALPGWKAGVLQIGMGLAILLSGCVSSSIHQETVKDLAAARSDLDRLRDENTTLKSEVAARQAVIQDLRQQLKEGESKGQMQSQDVDRLAKRNLDLVGEVANLSSQNRDLSQTLEARDQELEQVRNRIAGLENAEEEKTTRFKSMYDKLVGGFQNEIKTGAIGVTQEGDKLSVNMVETSLFKPGSAEIKPMGLKLLDRVGQILKLEPDQPIRIEGYTDNVPIGSRRSDKFRNNWELSAARAVNVVRYLSGPVGIPPARLSASAFADNHPVASNQTKEGRARNSRIEIVVLPTDAAQGLLEPKSQPPSP
ncbi:MAG TPA: OmpA family protein [Nitrospiria bacterium]|jgi:chemotaxis protein MotB|nr:OmpA family protein [Nitrospiria bacterium]